MARDNGLERGDLYNLNTPKGYASLMDRHGRQNAPESGRAVEVLGGPAHDAFVVVRRDQDQLSLQAGNHFQWELDDLKKSGDPLPPQFEDAEAMVARYLERLEASSPRVEL